MPALRDYQKRMNEGDPIDRIVFQNFFSLVRPRLGNATRDCLKCGKTFKSQGGVRLCYACTETNRWVGKSAYPILQEEMI